MRQSTPWLLFIAALLTVAHAGTIPNYPFVYVTGKAAVRVRPNVADTTFTVLSDSPSASVAEHTVESRVAEVLKLLHAVGVGDSQIDASALTKEAVTADDSDGKPLSIRGYRVSRSIEARISDLKKWPQIAKHLLGLQNVTDMQVTFGRANAKAIEESLLGKAAKDAKKRAQLLAASFGQHAGQVMALSRSRFESIDGSFLGAFYGNVVSQMVMVPPPPGDSTLLVPSNIKLSVEVHAIVKLQ
ncbi:MAG: SIMPL domain-containing protein [Proteobacteria bacterium]|nr:SIMPL domain-containing protein [Pseudomonadota bacterium]